MEEIYYLGQQNKVVIAKMWVLSCNQVVVLTFHNMLKFIKYSLLIGYLKLSSWSTSFYLSSSSTSTNVLTLTLTRTSTLSPSRCYQQSRTTCCIFFWVIFFLIRLEIHDVCEKKKKQRLEEGSAVKYVYRFFFCEGI